MDVRPIAGVDGIYPPGVFVPIAEEVMGEGIEACAQSAPRASYDQPDLVRVCGHRLVPQRAPRYFEQRNAAFPRAETRRIPNNQPKAGGVHQITTECDRLAAPER